MEDLKFKDVYQHHIGCLISDREYPEEGIFEMDLPMLNEYIKQHEEHITPMEHFTDYFKPILFPLSAMTDEQRENWGFAYEEGKFSSSVLEFDSKVGMSTYLLDVNTAGRTVLELLRNHFNVFNLPESEYIDASKLPVNPYSKP